jgi:ENTS family enterobactin (siderophore) exporter
MNRQSWLLNLSLLKTHPAFRAVFLARFISIVSLGLLGVAVPVQIQMMTQSTWQVGLSVTLTGSAMFIGLMVGGCWPTAMSVKSDPAGAWNLWYWLYWPVSECVARTVVAGDLSAWLMGWFLCFAGRDRFAGSDASAGWAREFDAGRAITMLTVRLGSVISPMLGGVLLATGGVAWNYGLAAAGTFITLLPLLSLPALPPPPQPREHPLKSLLAAFRFRLPAR